MNYKRMLFIGGVGHGQKLRILENVLHWDIPVFTSVDNNPWFTSMDYCPQSSIPFYRNETYRIMTFKGKTSLVDVMVLEEMTSGDVLECLLTNYPDPPSASCECSLPVASGPIKRIIEV